MRKKGSISNWRDDRGFGFVTPSGGGDDVFLHISAFKNRQRRPRRGEMVSYEVTTDDQGRARAAQARFADESALPRIKFSGASTALVGAAVFLSLVAGSAFSGHIPTYVFYAYLTLSVVAFAMMALDKRSAQSRGARIAEKTLWLVSLFGGWPGVWVAQQQFRHKSRKISFRLVFWLTVVINCAAFVWMHTPEGLQQLQEFLERL